MDPRDPRYPQYLAQQQAARGPSMGHEVQQALAEWRQERQELERRMNGVSGHVRSELNRQEKILSDFAAVAQALKLTATAGQKQDSPGVVRIEDIPGRRVPFTLLVDIFIGPDTTSVRESSVTITQEGPFVATRRMATFQSLYEYQVTNPETSQRAQLAGRSFGRYRPIHSAADIVDANHAAIADSSQWFLDAAAGPPAAGTILPSGTLSLPSNMSSFRTMEFDGRVSVINSGSGWPTQNISVPTPFWTQYMNSPFELSALDFIERGETRTFEVQPTHVNNPPAGNVDGECIFPAAAAAGFLGFPFVEGQYDAHEGICSPAAVVQGDGGTEGDWEPSLTDPIARVPAGVLTIGYEGYRITQGPGAPAP